MNKTVIFYTRIFIVISFIFWPIFYFLIWLKRRDIKKDDNLNILIIPQFKRIGDIVCSTPVFRAIKEKYPDSRISVIVSVMAAGILKNNPRIDEIILIEDYYKNFTNLIKKIREERFNWGISLSGTALSSLLLFFGVIPERIKITRTNRPLAEILTDWLCNKKEPYITLSYLPLFYLDLLKYLGIYKYNDKKEVFSSKESEERAVKFLFEKGIKSNDRVVGISLTAGNKIKEWGDDRFEELSRKIYNLYGYKIMFIGGLGDKERIDRVIDRIDGGNKFINCAGFDLVDLPSLMRRFDCFISVDTGPIHIAEALGISLIDILGPVNDIELTPRGKYIRVVKPREGIPPTIFAFRETGDEELTRGALDSIGVDQVLMVFDSLIKNKNS